MLRTTRFDASGSPPSGPSSMARWSRRAGSALGAIACAAGLLALAAGCSTGGGSPAVGMYAPIREDYSSQEPIQHAIEVQVLTLEGNQPQAR